MTDPESAPTTPSASDESLDALVLEIADAEWRKVAVFIAMVIDVAKAGGLETSGQLVAQRIYALVETGALAAKGNVRRWRAGEVRKPQP
jgi:hypothetical protein